MKKNVCFVLIILISLLLESYGLFLSHAGYHASDDSKVTVGKGIARAFNSPNDGIYPWNLKEMLAEYNEMTAGIEDDHMADSVYEDEGSVLYDDYDMIDSIAGGVGGWEHDYAATVFDMLTGAGEGTADAAKDSIVTDVNDDLSAEKTDTGEEASEYDISAADPSEYYWPQPWEFTEVDDSYFDDAVFIGDSRMVGLYTYGNMENATFYAATSSTVYNIMKKRVKTGYSGTVREGLTENRFGKIYIMLGVNELGIAGTDYYIDHYRELIDEIKELQPDALIYIHAIGHVRGVPVPNNRAINNSNINEKNLALYKLAMEEGAVFLDINSVYDDETGNLKDEATGDGVHVNAKHTAEWHEFYNSHAVSE
ncbi:MAG: hypothetical protein K6C99_10330 [Lachnospiraceae bacterium]|nr:hypothetical protein [Lachnospiraceae bacterium]